MAFDVNSWLPLILRWRNNSLSTNSSYSYVALQLETVWLDVVNRFSLTRLLYGYGQSMKMSLPEELVPQRIGQLSEWAFYCKLYMNAFLHSIVTSELVVRNGQAGFH